MHVKSTCRAPGAVILRCSRLLVCSGTLLPFLLGLAGVGRQVHAAIPPVLLDYRFLSPDTLSDGRPRPLIKDDTIILLTEWDVPDSAQFADSLRVTADFSRLDPRLVVSP